MFDTDPMQVEHMIIDIARQPIFRRDLSLVRRPSPVDDAVPLLTKQLDLAATQRVGAESRDHHGGTAGTKTLQKLEHEPCGIGVKTAGGFVCQYDFGITDH